MAEKSRRYRIGYALAPKKVQSFIQPSLIHTANQRGIDLIQIDLTKPLIHQAPFDCVIHKLSSPEWIRQLQEFQSRHPNVVVVDPPDAIERLHSRNSMLEAVDELKLGHESSSIGIPKQVFVESPESVIDKVSSEGMNFPVIAKPLVADGSIESHQMSLVLNKEGLKELQLHPPFVLQEFVNHGGVIFKVYVAGDHVQCVKRKSLPDISEEKMKMCASENVVSFSQISNLNVQDRSDESVMKLIESAQMPPLSFVNLVANRLRRALRLRLLNFDMIRDTRVGDRYLIIDVNYFPGYAKMPFYEDVLTDFFLTMVQEKQSVDYDDNGESVV